MSYFTASDSYLGLDEKEAQSLFGKMTEALTNGLRDELPGALNRVC